MSLYTVLSLAKDKSPPFHVWQKGTIVMDLPEDLMEFTHVRVILWKPYKYITTDVSCALRCIQDHLKTTGLLVFGFLRDNEIQKAIPFPNQEFEKTPKEFMMNKLTGVATLIEEKDTHETRVVAIQYGIPITIVKQCSECLEMLDDNLDMENWNKIADGAKRLHTKICQFLEAFGIEYEGKQPKGEYHFCKGELTGSTSA